MQLLEFEAGVLGMISIALIVVKMWALVDAILRRAEAYVAADKLTKVAWLWILGITLVWQVMFPYAIGIVNIAGTVAAFVYLLDVRPALVAVTRRR